jgi:hypothetical protein
MQYTSIVYGYSSSRICGSDVSHVTGNAISYVRKYVLRKRNRKLRHIRPSGAFRPEMTVTWPEAVLTGSMFCACPAFSPAFFFLVVVQLYHGYRMWPKITWPPSGFSWVCACTTGSCATPVMTEGHVTPLEVSMGCSLRRPRPITIGNPASYI